MFKKSMKKRKRKKKTLERKFNVIEGGYKKKNKIKKYSYFIKKEVKVDKSKKYMKLYFGKFS